MKKMLEKKGKVRRWKGKEESEKRVSRSEKE